jgi:hypothetical protein
MNVRARQRFLLSHRPRLMPVVVRATLLRCTVLAAPLLLTGSFVGAQTPAPAPQAGPTTSAAPLPAPRPGDVASPEALIAALYETISGPPGQARDWDRLRALLAPGARMVPVLPRREGGFAAVQLSADDYIRRSGDMLVRFGFVERELARRTERFGNVVHAWSSYEGRFTAPGAPTAEAIRGINSIQLTSDGSRWYVLSIT